MEAIRLNFEKTLRTKLAQRSTSAFSEEKMLERAFKFFDTDNSGTVDAKEFRMAAERIGVFLSSHREAENLLACYDFDGNGTLDYKEFSSIVFGHKKAPA